MRSLHTLAGSSRAIAVATPRKPIGCSSAPKMGTELLIAGRADYKRSARKAGVNARSFGTNATFTALIQEYTRPGKALRKRIRRSIDNSRRTK